LLAAGFLANKIYYKKNKRKKNKMTKKLKNKKTKTKKMTKMKMKSMKNMIEKTKMMMKKQVGWMFGAPELGELKKEIKAKQIIETALKKMVKHPRVGTIVLRVVVAMGGNPCILATL
jgi:hypothetical protein